MRSTDAYDIALSLTRLYFTSLQVFVAICSAFGGWILVGNQVRDLAPFATERFALILIFSASCTSLVMGQVFFISKINAALTVAEQLFKTETTTEIDGSGKLFAHGDARSTVIGMGAVIVLIDVLLLFRGTLGDGIIVLQ